MQSLLDAKSALVPWASGPYGVNLSLCILEYVAVNTLWCAARGKWPPRRTLARQVSVSVAAAPWYAILPTAMEHLALSGATRLHAGPLRLREVLIFLAVTDVCVYAVHRALHEIRWLYTRIHRRHHEYKTPGDLSPFASLAFHPLDGLAQAAPYALAALVLPCHLGAWEVLLFLTGVWSSSIHDDESWASVPGVLGAKHHTLHHTAFRCNYGQYLTTCDWLFGTLKNP